MIVSRHRRDAAGSAVALRTSGPVAPRPRAPRRSRPLLPGLAVVVALGFLLVSIVDPYSGAYAAEDRAPAQLGAAQIYAAPSVVAAAEARDGYGVTKPPPPAAATTAPKKAAGSSAPAVGLPDPGTAQAIAWEMLQARGMGQDQYSCLVALWKKESGWNVYAFNKGSGAYGIPQALPGSKMASAGADWQTNPATQITWGLGYVTGRYGSPCGAWSKSQSSGWY